MKQYRWIVKKEISTNTKITCSICRWNGKLKDANNFIHKDHIMTSYCPVCGGIIQKVVVELD